MARREFMPVAVQIVGNLDYWETVYTTLGTRYPTRRGAIGAGLRHYGHDDFLIAILHGDELVGIAWQTEDRSPDDFAYEAPKMAQQLGWKVRLPNG